MHSYADRLRTVKLYLRLGDPPFELLDDQKLSQGPV